MFLVIGTGICWEVEEPLDESWIDQLEQTLGL